MRHGSSHQCFRWQRAQEAIDDTVVFVKSRHAWIARHGLSPHMGGGRGRYCTAGRMAPRRSGRSVDAITKNKINRLKASIALLVGDLDFRKTRQAY
jgi:hypothetical protein